MFKVRKISRLAIPLIVAQLAQASMGFVDTILMGMLGVEVLAGGGLGAAVFQFFIIVCTGVLMASSNIIAFAIGKKDNEEVHQALLSSMAIAVVLALLFGFFLWNIGGVLSAMGQANASIAITEVYLRSVVWAMLPALAFMALRNLVLGFGHTGSLLRIALIGAVCNFPVSYVLMLGLFGFPEFGLKGIGYGTTFVSLMMFVIFSWDVYRSSQFKIYPFWRGWRSFNFGTLRSVLRLGVPISIAYAMEAGLFTAAALLAGMIGAVQLAAHQIALQCITLSFMIPVGLSQAVSIIVGQSYGANRLQDVEGYARAGVAMGVVCSLSAAFVFWFFPESIVALFTQSKEASDLAVVQEAGIKLLWVAAIFQLVDGVQVITMGALRGLKLAASPTVITIIGYWGVGFPCAYWLMDDWGLQGIWGGLGIGLAVTSLMLVTLFIVHLRRLKLEH